MTTAKRYPVIPDPSILQAAEASGVLEHQQAFDVPYRRFVDAYRIIPRGTVLLPEGIMPGYPKIGRIVSLRGLARSFDGPFHVEEKIDGYNVRIVRSGGRYLAFTRSGLVCPFTTDRLPDLIAPSILEAVFTAHPDAIICAEVAGAANPYIDSHSARVPEDIALFAFDVMALDREHFWPMEERNRLFLEYGIPAVPMFGTYRATDLEPLRDIVRRLDEEGGEGIIAKHPNAPVRVKYVTPSINVDDVRAEAPLELELPPEYYVSRIVRMAIALRELGLEQKRPELAAKLGHWLLSGFDRALDELERSGAVAKTFKCRVREETTIDRLIQHLNASSRTVQVKELTRRKENGWWVVEFRKEFLRSTSILTSLLGGKVVFD
ncbi:MAG: RNA ligase [Nitrospirae bacterium]|nr:MAG: RNA ligase [Nitrospirota bacterium]